MHVVITGASSGIGACLAREFHHSGAEVTIVARRAALLEQLKAELGSRCEVVVADLSAPDPTSWLREVAPMDVFINNAGFNISGAFDEAPPERVAKMFQVDLHAPIALARAVVPAMIARGQGALVNVSSVAGIVPPAGMAVYSAAKAGLAAFSEALRAEVRHTGVHVLTVYPGPIDNGTVDANAELYGNGAKMAPWGDPRELSREIRLALQRRKARVIFPRFYHLARAFPGITRWVVDSNTPQIKRLPGVTGVRETA